MLDLVGQLPELAVAVHVAVGQEGEADAAALDARPGAPAREVEGQHEAGDEQAEGEPDDGWPGSLLTTMPVQAPTPAQ